MGQSYSLEDDSLSVRHETFRVHQQRNTGPHPESADCSSHCHTLPFSRSSLMLCFHLQLGFTSGVFPSVFQLKFCVFLIYHIHVTCSTNLIFLDLVIVMISRQQKSCTCHFVILFFFCLRTKYFPQHLFGKLSVSSPYGDRRSFTRI